MTVIQPQKFVRRLRKHSRVGSAAIESVLVMMLLLSLAFGIVEWGWYFYVRHSFEGAAREGARVGIVSSNANTDVKTAISNYMTACGLSGSGYATKIEAPLGTSCSVGSVSSGTEIYVTVYGTWSVAGSGFSPLHLISSSKIVSSAVAMRHE